MLPDMRHDDHYSWALDRPVTGAFAHPRGIRGHLAGWLMQWGNGRSAREVAARMPLRPGDRVLEVGFGPAALLHALATRPERPVLVGVDPSPVMLARARRRVRAADLRAGTAAETGLPDGSVDHVVSVNTVALWPDLDAGLDELRRVLRPGGSLTLAWHAASARSRVSRGLGLPAAVLDRIEDGLRQRFDGVARTALTDVLVFGGTRPPSLSQR